MRTSSDYKNSSDESFKTISSDCTLRYPTEVIPGLQDSVRSNVDQTSLAKDNYFYTTDGTHGLLSDIDRTSNNIVESKKVASHTSEIPQDSTMHSNHFTTDDDKHLVNTRNSSDAFHVPNTCDTKNNGTHKTGNGILACDASNHVGKGAYTTGEHVDFPVDFPTNGFLYTALLENKSTYV